MAHPFVITTASQKGGVSKSCLTIHMATEATRKKKRAIIVELDRQGTASQVWSRARVNAETDRDLLDAVERRVRPPNVVHADASRLNAVLQQLKQAGYQYIFIDVPGTHSPATQEAISAADFVLVPTRPNATDITASAETVGTIHRLRRPFAYVLTFIQKGGPKAKPAREAREALEEEGHIVAPGGLSDLKDYEVAIETGETVLEMDPNGTAAAQVKTLWKWLEGQLDVINAKKVA